MNSGENKDANVDQALQLIQQAAGAGADLVALPEEFNFLGSPEDHLANAEAIPGPTINALAETARDRNIHVLAGSILESIPGSDKVYNTSVLLDPNGHAVARYRKIHLFDVVVEDQVHSQESATMDAGDEVVAVESELATLGLSICYDLRFPELYRSLALAGAEVVFSPAAFSLFTGKDHWELLVRTRAVENGYYMVAPAQRGSSPGFQSFGSAMIVDPWGTVITRAPERDTVVVADIDVAEVRRVRASIPSLQHRRPDAYRL